MGVLIFDCTKQSRVMCSLFIMLFYQPWNEWSAAEVFLSQSLSLLSEITSVEGPNLGKLTCLIIISNTCVLTDNPCGDCQMCSLYAVGKDWVKVEGRVSSGYKTHGRVELKQHTLFPQPTWGFPSCKGSDCNFQSFTVVLCWGTQDLWLCKAHLFPQHLGFQE